MESNQPVTPAQPPNQNQKIMAIAALVIGIINLCGWFLPICGIPLGILGIVLGYFGMKAPEQKNLAIAGMALAGLGLVLACVNAIVGVVFAPEIERMMNDILREF